MKQRHHTRKGPGRMPYRRRNKSLVAGEGRARQAPIRYTLAGAGDTLTLRVSS